ncbi:hypothetical protein AM592_01830 [Bacillus gobiensis]|uniref:Uncharacterized protein n=1 Tax=Bacillus gobiensis TaxID=1441095 RepID=A0A0M4FEA0_9BACI|nr:hypothetical protein AM592_01830 [Bacillus gobiensis]
MDEMKKTVMVHTLKGSYLIIRLAAFLHKKIFYTYFTLDKINTLINQRFFRILDPDHRYRKSFRIKTSTNMLRSFFFALNTSKNNPKNDLNDQLRFAYIPLPLFKDKLISSFILKNTDYRFTLIACFHH